MKAQTKKELFEELRKRIEDDKREFEIVGRSTKGHARALYLIAEYEHELEQRIP